MKADTDDGYFKVANAIAEGCCKVSLNGSESRVLWAIMRKTWGYRKKQDKISHSQLADLTGLNRCHIARAIKGLCAKGCIFRGDGILGVNTKMDDWKQGKTATESGSSTKSTATESGSKTATRSGTHKRQERQERQYREIVDDLNAVTGRNFTTTAPATQRLIRARCAEGFTLDDFKAVHRVKARQWKGDPKWSRFLRPSTLYAASKFEGYLQEAKDGSQSEPEVKDHPAY